MRQTSFVLTVIGAVIGLATLIGALLFAGLNPGLFTPSIAEARIGLVAASAGAGLLVAIAIIGAFQQSGHPRVTAAILVVDAVIGFVFTGVLWIIPAALFLVAAALGLSRPKPRSAPP